MSVTGKTAMVTAATSGIGLAVAQHLLSAGLSGLAINARRAATGEEVRDRLRREFPGARIEFYAADLTDLDAVEGVFRSFSADFTGKLDIFVHCGGADVPPGLFLNLDPRAFRQQVDGHFTAMAFATHYAAKLMVPRNRGSIITVASDAAKVATPAETIIGAAKAAAVMFTRTIALELSRYGIRANCLTPSLVGKTRSYDRVLSTDAGKRVFEKAIAKAKLGLPVPDDIAPLAVFLASDASSRLTGQAISVNGGISAA